jgi:hypothetical protein
MNTQTVAQSAHLVNPPSRLERIHDQIERELTYARHLSAMTRTYAQARAIDTKINRHKLELRAITVLLEDAPAHVTSVRTMVLWDRHGHDSSLFLAAFSGSHMVAGVVNSTLTPAVTPTEERDWISAFDCTSNTLEYTGEVSL